MSTRTAKVKDELAQSPDWLTGLALLKAWALTGRVFTGNDCRKELRAAGFGQFTSGRLFQLAETDGVIRQCGIRKSTDPRTRGAFLREWIGILAPATSAFPAPRKPPSLVMWSAEAWDRVFTVACPVCDAQRGYDCSAIGNASKRAQFPHGARRSVAEGRAPSGNEMSRRRAS